MLWERVRRPAGSRDRAELPARCDVEWFAETFCGGADLSLDIADIEPYLVCLMLPDAVAMLACCPDALDHFFEVETKAVQPLVPSKDTDKKNVSGRARFRSLFATSSLRTIPPRVSPSRTSFLTVLVASCVQGVRHMCIGLSRKVSGVANPNELRSLFTYGLNPKLAMGERDYEKVLQARSANGKSKIGGYDLSSLTNGGDDQNSQRESELDSFDDGSYPGESCNGESES